MLNRVTVNTANKSDVQIKQRLGAAFRKFVEEDNVSQAELATRIGSTRQFVFQLVSGGSSSFKTISRLAAALGLRVKITIERDM